jgi:hypothetical protein
VPNARSAQRKKSAPITMAPPIPTLITHPGSRSGTTPPPHRGGHPRPIASGLRLGNRNGLPTRNGVRDARKCNLKSAQNRNRKDLGRKSDN